MKAHRWRLPNDVSVVHQVESQQRALRRMLDLTRPFPVQQSVLRAQDWMRSFRLQPSALRALDVTRPYRLSGSAFLAPDITSLVRLQQERLRELMDPQLPVLRYHEWLRSAVAPSALAELASYRADLASWMATAIPGDGVVDDHDAVWFGAPSWDVLVWELQTLLKSLETITSTLGVAKVGLHAPVSDALLAVMLLLVVVGELALHVAHGPPDGP
jgi:hypothetical protein